MEVHASEFPLTRTTFSRFLGCLCLGVVLELFNSLRMVSELVAVFSMDEAGAPDNKLYSPGPETKAFGQKTDLEFFL